MITSALSLIHHIDARRYQLLKIVIPMHGKQNRQNNVKNLFIFAKENYGDNEYKSGNRHIRFHNQCGCSNNLCRVDVVWVQLLQLLFFNLHRPRLRNDDVRTRVLHRGGNKGCRICFRGFRINIHGDNPAGLFRPADNRTAFGPYFAGIFHPWLSEIRTDVQLRPLGLRNDVSLNILCRFDDKCQNQSRQMA